MRVPTHTTIYAGHPASFNSTGPYVRANLYAFVLLLLQQNFYQGSLSTGPARVACDRVSATAAR